MSAAVPAEPTCEADVALAGLARLAYCTSPLASEPQCLATTLRQTRLARLACQTVTNLDEVEIALLDPTLPIEEIEAEPLLQALDPAEQKAFEEQQVAKVEEQHERAEREPMRQPTAQQQIVEITQPTVEQPPENARFLSEFDSRVEQEKVARGSTEDMVARPGPKELAKAKAPSKAPAVAKEQAPGPIGDNAEAPPVPGKLAMREPGAPERVKESQSRLDRGIAEGLDAPIGPNGSRISKGNAPYARPEREATDSARPGEGGGGGGSKPNLRVSEEILERALGGGSVDHLDDVATGDETLLNSVRWKYASFFNRVKRTVAQNWRPAELLVQRDPSGQVYGARDKVTRLKIWMTPDGRLDKIVVMQGSGVDFLDDEAVRAFQAAQPFPNPPAALVDARTKLITFEFGFHLEIEKSTWKIFR